MFPCLATLVLTVLLPISGWGPRAQDVPQPGSGPVIVWSKHPRDSRGETVYTRHVTQEKGVTLVSGVLIDPKPLTTPKPKYSKAMKKAKYQGEVTVVAVVTQAGEVIDMEAVQPADPEAAQAALAAVSRYRFTPATLDGKPVAVLLRVIVNFRIW